jgi:Skp family chaperone for outer membrane proteins
MKRFFPAVLAALVLAGCGHSSSSGVAVVNVARITSNWPKFINYNNQISADAAAIERSSANDQDKQREREQLQAQYLRMQTEVTNDVRDAAAQVAKQRNFKLVVTREFAAYGGTDITPDVEKILNITERATPAP